MPTTKKQQLSTSYGLLKPGFWVVFFFNRQLFLSFLLQICVHEDRFYNIVVHTQRKYFSAFRKTVDRELTELTCSYVLQQLHVAFRKLCKSQRGRDTRGYFPQKEWSTFTNITHNSFCVMYRRTASRTVILPSHWSHIVQRQATEVILWVAERESL